MDFGSQFTQLIARRVRESGVYAELRPFNTSMEEIRSFAPKALILSGGPASVGDWAAPKIPEEVLNMGIPVLGICYGQQLMSGMLGGKVEPSSKREFGRASLVIKGKSDLFDGMPEKFNVWMSHGDKVTEIPEGFSVIASTDSALFAAIANEEKKIYGVQFHPEVTHTENGKTLLSNFTHKIAGISSGWDMRSFKDEQIEKIRERTGSERVLCGVSGGVDSSVVAALLHEAIGDRLVCVFVDTGMLREGEADQVEEALSRNLKINLVRKDSSRLFLERLAGVTDPEKKRKIIGNSFVEVFEKEVEEQEKRGGKFGFLAQGTLYPDVIESVSFSGAPSSTIKTHHNVGGLPERMKLKLVEPLRELFKDEVRALGRELGLPGELVDRHPFPGPGLAIRIPGEISGEKLELLRKADSIYIEEIRKAGLYDKIWQAFAVLLPVRSVGVMGDGRTYEYVCALRAVTSTDGMTADYFHFSHDFLSSVSNRIVNEVRGINRVVYDVTSKPPGTIEWE